MYFWLGKVSALTFLRSYNISIFNICWDYLRENDRTTEIVWGKAPEKIVTDGEKTKSALSKVMVPQILICFVWMIAELPTVQVKGQ